MTGLFSIEGFPHKGWFFVDCEDVEDCREICEACGRQEIRYVHILKHPNFFREIRVGSECARNLCEGYNSAEIERLTKQKYNFIKSKCWKTSKKGNPTIRKNNYRVTITHTFNWNFVISSAYLPKEIWGNNFTTEIIAKKAAFDKLKEIEEKGNA